MKLRTKIIIEDLISPIPAILAYDGTDRQQLLIRLISRHREINAAHLLNRSVSKTVDRLLEPNWIASVRKFNRNEWYESAEKTYSDMTKLLGPQPAPSIILYPSFGSMNGRVYRVAGKLVIGCSPDFPQTTGKNLNVLLAHEYAHFIRWKKIGLTQSMHRPLYVQLLEEGWAVWLSHQLLPKVSLSRIFMSNLHKSISMPDPKEGYLRWCRKNLLTIAYEARKNISSKDKKVIGRFFQGQRFKGDKTPIRTGYYLGYKLVEMLAREMTPKQLFELKLNHRKVSRWLDQLTKKLESMDKMSQWI